MCILVACIHLLEDNTVWVVDRGGMCGARERERESARSVGAAHVYVCELVCICVHWFNMYTCSRITPCES